MRVVIVSVFPEPNSSNRKIDREQSLGKNSVHDMATQLREEIKAKQLAMVLSDEVESDEVYVVAGHQGLPMRSKKGDGDVGGV